MKLDTEKIIHSHKSFSQCINHISFSSRGDKIIFGSSSERIKVWLLGGFIYTYNAHKQLVKYVAFSPDSKKFISASKEGEIKIWDLDKNDTTENNYLLTKNIQNDGPVEGISYRQVPRLVIRLRNLTKN